MPNWTWSFAARTFWIAGAPTTAAAAVTAVAVFSTSRRETSFSCDMEGGPFLVDFLQDCNTGACRRAGRGNMEGIEPAMLKMLGVALLVLALAGFAYAWFALAWDGGTARASGDRLLIGLSTLVAVGAVGMIARQ